MRIAICDQQVSFGESLAYVLTARGDRVVAVVQQSSEALVVASRRPAELCVVRLTARHDLDGKRHTTLRALAALVPVVLIVDDLTTANRSAAVAAGVRGLGEMRQGIDDVLRLIDRVHRGGTALDTVPRPAARGRVDAGCDTVRLASFLSARERSVLSALVRGDDTATIARTMGVSTTTARGHVQGVLTKLGTHSRVAAVTTAVRSNLVNPRTGDWLVS